ncbi:MAG TPA: hypothetical protein VGR11_16990, partial [Solirubrobacteraceae bacterium]|nr:hypothetical protein [Solirubrobacteraceae bacterium]
MSSAAPPDLSSSKDDLEVHVRERTEHRARIAARDVGSLIPAIVAVGAALGYGVLILSYSEFYAELGVRPGDVGLEFGPGLGGIAGVAVLLIGGGAAAGFLYVALSRWLKHGDAD